jgi:hypothetical protein
MALNQILIMEEEKEVQVTLNEWELSIIKRALSNYSLLGYLKESARPKIETLTDKVYMTLQQLKKDAEGL